MMMKTLMTALALLLAATIEAGAQSSYKVGHIEVSGVWARASAGRASAGAAYFSINNRGGQADRLVAVATEVARKAELHTHIMKDNVMRMERVDGLDLPGNGDAVLKPGGHHVMLMGLAAPLKRGATFPMALTFAKAGTVTVEVAILGPGARGPRHHRSGDHERRHGAGSPHQGHQQH